MDIGGINTGGVHNIFYMLAKVCTNNRSSEGC